MRRVGMQFGRAAPHIKLLSLYPITMSYESLITHNRIAQFAARFAMQPDGSVVYYHPDRKTGGLPCSLAEYEQLIQEYAHTMEYTTKRTTYWVILSGITLGVLEASEWLLIDKWMQYFIMLVPLPILFYGWYQAGLKPLRFLRTRIPCSPPRTIESAFWNRIAALPTGLFLAMLLPSAGLVYYAVTGVKNLDLSSLLIIGTNLFMTVLWLYARNSRKN